MSESASFGYWVRQRRKALDITQVSLARNVGCAEITIQKIEADERRPSAQIAALLAEQLQIPADERAAFLAAARGELIPDRVATPAIATRPSPRETRTSAPAHNLPSALTSFVGRTRELATIAAMLAEARLLTLTGPGGSGKTRLALELAGLVLQQFPNGIWLVDLAPLTDPALIVPALAALLDVREDPGRPLLTALTSALREQRTLLILDNCEHLIDACAQLATTLLQACPRLRLLTSSREPLGVAGEVVFRVPALSVPNPQQLPSLEQLGQYEAVQLFLARAIVGGRAFELTAATAAPLAEICARLDGIPLAIELAAARTRVLTIEQIAARLNDRFRLLTGGSRTALPRHQTLQALIDWSYELLSDAERTLLRRLAVFAGGWTLEAAEAIAAELSIEHAELKKDRDRTAFSMLNAQFSILDGLTQLVDKSLVQVEQVGNAARYRMLETIRQYALEKLAASGEADTIRRRHAQYYLQLAEQQEDVAGDWLEPIAQWASHMTQLETEYDNLRAALTWSQAAGGAEIGLRLTLKLQGFWSFCGLKSEARDWRTSALAHPEAQQRTRLRAQVLHDLGVSYGNLSDYTAAHVAFSESLSIYQELEDAHGCADTLIRLGWLARQQGDTTTALARLLEGLELARKLDDRWRIAMGLLTLGEVAVMLGDARWAAELLEEGQTLARSFEHPHSSAWALNHLGHLAQIEADYTRAKQLHTESLALFRQTSDQHLGIAWALHGLGESALAQNDLPDARTHLAASLAYFRTLGERAGVSWCLAGLGSAAALDEEPERAAQLWGAAERLRAALGSRSAPAARATYDRAVAIARAQLGDQAFAAAWAAGEALSLDAVIAEVLESGD